MIKLIRLIAFTVVIGSLSYNSADAKPKQRYHNTTLSYCQDQTYRDVCPSIGKVVAGKAEKLTREARIETEDRFLPHPAGCPRIAFCACGAAVEVFGKPIRSLWPARAWYKFPRSAPGYKTVAVRNHHVMVLISHVGGNEWLVRDYNSGGHKSREHIRSISGYKIVNPNGSLAMLE